MCKIDHGLLMCKRPVIGNGILFGKRAEEKHGLKVILHKSRMMILQREGTLFPTRLIPVRKISFAALAYDIYLYFI